MRKSVPTAIFLLAFSLCLYVWWSQASTAPSERALQMTVVSPDGSSEARVYSNFWTGALGVDSDSEQTIEIWRVGQEAVPALSRDHTVARFNWRPTLSLRFFGRTHGVSS